MYDVNAPRNCVEFVLTKLFSGSHIVLELLWDYNGIPTRFIVYKDKVPKLIGNHLQMVESINRKLKK